MPFGGLRSAQDDKEGTFPLLSFRAQKGIAPFMGESVFPVPYCLVPGAWCLVGAGNRGRTMCDPLIGTTPPPPLRAVPLPVSGEGCPIPDA